LKRGRKKDLGFGRALGEKRTRVESSKGKLRFWPRVFHGGDLFGLIRVGGRKRNKDGPLKNQE